MATEASPTVVNYPWRWSNHLPSLILWAMLVASFAGIRENRSVSSLLVLIPLGIDFAIVGMLGQLIGPSRSIYIREFVLTYCLSLAILLLWTGVLGGLKRGIRIGLAFVILAGTGATGLGGTFGWKNDSLSQEVFPFYALLIASFGFSFLLSRWRCGNIIRPKRFSTLLFLWMVLLNLSFQFGYLMIKEGLEGMLEISLHMWILVVSGVILAVLEYLFLVPFLILGFRNPEFYKRLADCLGWSEPMKQEPAVASEATP